MYPRNKPLPPEAARRVANLVGKKGNNMANSDVILESEVATSSGTPILMEHSSDSSSLQQSSQQGISSVLNSRVMHTSMPTSHSADKVKETPLYSSNCCNGSCDANGESTLFLPNGTPSPHNKAHIFPQHFVPQLPPPYEESAAQTNDVAEEQTYECMCCECISPVVSPPFSHWYISNGGCVDESFYDRFQPQPRVYVERSVPPHSSSVRHRRDRWRSESRFSTFPLCNFRRYNLCNGEVQTYAPNLYTVKSKGGSFGRSQRNSTHFSVRNKEGVTIPQLTQEALAMQKTDKNGEKQKKKKMLSDRKKSTESKISAPLEPEGQEKQEGLLNMWEENAKNMFQQHSQDVKFLIQVIVSLLERITTIKTSMCVNKNMNDGGSVKSVNSSSLNLEEEEHVEGEHVEGEHVEGEHVEGEREEEEASVLKEQLGELQEVLHSIQTNGEAVRPNFSRLLTGILSLPQLLPLSNAAAASLEDMALSLYHTGLIPEKNILLSRGMSAEVKSLMTALDFDITRPVMVNLVAASSSSSTDTFHPLKLTVDTVENEDDERTTSHSVLE